jgi:hypothetical protein
MKPKKVIINGESITWRINPEYFYKNDEIRGINEVSASIKVNNNPYRSLKNAGFSTHFGIVATVILLYNKANNKDIRISAMGKIEDYLDWYFDRIDMSHVRWVYDMRKEKNFTFDEKTLLKRAVGQMRELYPYSFMFDFNNIDKESIEEYDEDDDNRYEIWYHYIEMLSKKFILSMVDELDILVKQGKLNEFNPLNDMNKVITIQDMSEKEKENLSNIDEEKDEVASEMAKRFEEIVLGINNANPFIRRQFNINDSSEVETREIDDDCLLRWEDIFI